MLGAIICWLCVMPTLIDCYPSPDIVTASEHTQEKPRERDHSRLIKHYDSVTAKHNRPISFDNHHALWKEHDYWNEALRLFGRAYPRNTKVNLPPEYKCFCTDNTHSYYVHDSERYLLMEQWQLYDYPAFWLFIKHFPDYEECMLTINKLMRTNREVYGQLSLQAIRAITQEAERIKHNHQQRAIIAAQSTIRKNFEQQQKLLFMEVDAYQEVAHWSRDVGCGNGSLEKRIKALEQMKSGGAIYQITGYDLSRDAQDFLHYHGINQQSYACIYGNQIQQMVHKECVDCVDHLARMPKESLLYEQQAALVKCIDAAREYNQLGQTKKAVCVLDFCRILLDYGKAMFEGARDGLFGVVRGCYEHPVQTLLCCAAGEYLLAYHLGKLLIEVADIGITTLYDENKGTEKWQAFVAPLSTLVAQIANKEVGIRDAIKGATQVAAHWYAQGKMLQGVGSLCRSAHNKALAFAAENPSLTPEDYLARPDGYLLRTARVAENNKLVNTQNNFSDSKREIILPRVKTYEQARNKALQIIGEVDHNTGVPMTGKQGAVTGKLSGRRWHNYDVTLRLDHDNIKGAHFNVTDYRLGKRTSIAIPFEGSIELVRSLCKPLNTFACLRDAKHVFEKIGDARGLADVEKGLKFFTKK